MSASALEDAKRAKARARDLRTAPTGTAGPATDALVVVAVAIVLVVILSRKA